MESNTTYLKTSQVAKILNVHPGAVRRWIRLKELKTIKLGAKQIRIRKDDFEEFIQKKESLNV